MGRRKKTPLESLPDGLRSTITRASIYTRVSTEEQASDGHGLDAQKAEGLAYILLKGWECAGVYVDPGLSGTLDVANRPDLSRMIDDVKAGKIDVVIVPALDRLSRKPVITFTVIETLRRAGARLVSIREGIDSTTYDGEMKLGVYSMIANIERMNISQRTKSALTTLAKNQGVRGGGMYYGYKRLNTGKGNPGKDVEVNEEEAEIVRSIYGMVGMGPTTIAGILNRSGLRTQRGKEWKAATVYYILNHEKVYRGLERYESGKYWPVILN